MNPRGGRTPAILVALVALGVLLRLYHADWKLYNPDEANTSIRLSGHTNTQVAAFIGDGRAHRIEDLRTFAAPSASTPVSAVVHSLADEDPQHPPLFFIISFATQRALGDAIFVRRLPAIVFGIAALWAAWWFGRELFRDPWPAWCLAALVALSPFHVAYAQEAREYSLFLLTLCLSSALLLYALRTRQPWAFVAYAASVAAGLWSFTLFGLIVAAQVLAILLPTTAVPARLRVAAVLASGAGALTFLPWLVNLWSRADVAVSDTDWQSTPLSAPLYAGKWLFNLGSVFFDLDYLSLAWLPLVLLGLAVALCAWIVFVRKADPQCWTFPVAIGAITLIAVVGPDLLRHETRALQSRYLTALWFVIETGTAGGLWLALRGTRGTAQSLWRAGAASLFVLGFASCAVASAARTWWVTGAPELRAFPAIVDRLRSLPSPSIVFIEHDDDILLFEPYATGAMAFHLHARLDAAALASEPHPYAVLASGAAARLPVAAALTRIPVERSFETLPDPAIDELRRRASLARKWPSAIQLDLALYGLRATKR